MSLRPQIRKVQPPKGDLEEHSFARINDLMQRPAVTTVPHARTGHVKKILVEHGFHALPVVGPEGEPAGIVTTSDLMRDVAAAAPISRIMTRKVLTVPQYEEPAIAARMMRNHGVHHLVVTHEKKVVGIVSSFDLLRLIEDHGFKAKQRITRTKGRGDRKRRET